MCGQSADTYGVPLPSPLTSDAVLEVGHPVSHVFRVVPLLLHTSNSLLDLVNEGKCMLYLFQLFQSHFTNVRIPLYRYMLCSYIVAVRQ